MAILSAKAAYQIYQELFGGARFSKLKDLGARTQRLLWASTSTKNPAYDDLKYVEALIGPHTINTVPSETLTARADSSGPLKRRLRVPMLIFDWTFFRRSRTLASWFYPNLGPKAMSWHG